MRPRFLVVSVLLLVALAPLGRAQDAPPRNAADSTPTDEEGRRIVFLDDARTSGEEVLEPDTIFTHEQAAECLAAVQRLWTALGRVHRGLYHESNLHSFETVSGNPYTLQGERLKQLPEDARIVWRMGKDEFITLELPDWESIHIGAINHQRFLEAYADYKEYKIAHLQLSLLDAEGVKDGLERKALEKTRLRHKNAVIKYFKTPPAD